MAEPFIGQIVMFAGNFAPRSWALCDGQLLSISQNSALFSILGTTYGGDGRTTFGLPDLRGRVPMHPGNGPGLSPRNLGQKSGVENVTLNVNQIPVHNHALPASSGFGNAKGPSGNVPAMADDGERNYSSGTPNANMDPSTNAGGGQSHTNVQPFQCVNFIIALQGVFPSRN